MSGIFEDSDFDVGFKTNNEYAKKYDQWRNKEELNKLKTRYGEDLLDSEDSSSESDDEEGIELTEQVEKSFFKTLAYLKTKDPRIYDDSVKFFEDSEVRSAKAKKEKPVFIKDYERKLILEKKGVLSDEEDVVDRPKSPTYVEQQKQAKKNLKDVLNTVDDENEVGEWGGIFNKRKKTTEQIEKEESDYKQWLAGQKDELKDEETVKELKPLKDYWSEPNLDAGEKFLKDYILNKRFLDKDDSGYIPTYEEIVHDSDQNLSNDEETIERQEEFEHKYNFRFEEPDHEFIKRYPRTMENSVRRKDEKRKLKRQELKERKKKEKDVKMEDLKTLRELKRREIEEKLEKLKEITGNATLAFDNDDIEGDFDPEKHDKKMQELFNDGFYGEPEGDQKPVFPDLDEELDIENYEYFDMGDYYKNEGAPHCEDENFNMDCDYDPQGAAQQPQLINESKRKKKHRRKSKFVEAISKPKPQYDAGDRTFEQYFDEYYKLDCEDFIGDIPCRFKYRKVVPNDFGLSVEEILLAKERELNKWCSLKKAVQIRPDHVEKYDQVAYHKKAQNVALKKKILPSLFETEVEENVERENGNNTGKYHGSSENKVEDIEVKEAIGRKENRKKLITANHVEKVNHSVETNIDESKEKNIDAKIAPGKTARKRKPKKALHGLSNAIKTVDTNEFSITSNRIKRKNKTPSYTKVSPDKFDKKTRKRKTNCEGNAPNKRFKKANQTGSSVTAISDERLAAYGIKPKKFRNKLKYKK